MRTFTSLKEMLPLALGEVARRTTAGAALQPVWEELAGTAIARNSRPRELRDGVLTVAVSARAWAEELTAKSPELLARLQQRLGTATVRALKFEVAPLP